VTDAPVPTLVLASGSPQRLALLRGAGLGPTVVPADVDETPRDDEPAAALVERLARDKAAAVAGAHPGALVLGADTVVELDGTALGKPVDDADARGMLRALAGRRVVVRSGVALVAAAAGEGGVEAARPSVRSGRVDTTLWMRPLSQAEVDAYVATGEPHGAAGAFRVQDGGAALLERHRGCWANVVGLPLCLVPPPLPPHDLGPLDEPAHAPRPRRRST